MAATQRVRGNTHEILSEINEIKYFSCLFYHVTDGGGGSGNVKNIKTRQTASKLMIHETNT